MTNALMELPFTGSGFPMTAAFRDRVVGDEGTLDLSCADIVARDDDDVIGTAEDHDITVLSFYCKIADRIVPL